MTTGAMQSKLEGTSHVAAALILAAALFLLAGIHVIWGEERAARNLTETWRHKHQTIWSAYVEVERVPAARMLYGSSFVLAVFAIVLVATMHARPWSAIRSWPSIVRKGFRNSWTWRFATVCVLAGLVGVAVAAWWFRIASWQDLEIASVIDREFGPVGSALMWRRIHSGQPVSDAVRIAPPKRIDRLGDFEFLRYRDGGFSSLVVIARQGKVRAARAGGCTFKWKFFDTITEADDAEYARFRLQDRLFREVTVPMIVASMFQPISIRVGA